MSSTEVRIQKTIGAGVRSARENAGLSQAEVAKRSAIDLRRLKRIEAGQTNPTVRTLLRLAQAMDADFWGLVRPPADGK